MGLVGSALVRQLIAAGYENLLTRSRKELDLANQAAVAGFFHKEEPEYVFLAAAQVGGILANATCPADFIRENLLIQTNVIRACLCERSTSAPVSWIILHLSSRLSAADSRRIFHDGAAGKDELRVRRGQDCRR